MKILRLCSELSRELPDAVFIGGVAVYLHASSRPSADVEPEASHDADFMVSFADYGALKDVEELTRTERLAKHQMIYEGVEFDVYVEHMNKLVVPYDEALAHSETKHDTKIACLEHLLALKLEALASRGHSGKGEKDRRDVATICLLMGKRARRRLVEPYLDARTEEILRELPKGHTIYEMAGRNAHATRKMKDKLAASIASILK